MSDWIDTALRIGRRLAESAAWSEDRCTWTVQVEDLATGGPRPTPARGALYQGTAGIALFLGQLHAVTGDSEAARCARGAIEHALDDAASFGDDAWGYHSGRVGVAWSAVRLAEALDRPELVDRGLACLEPLARAESDRSLDVIGGAAGAIPALLDLARRLAGDPRAEGLSRRAEALGRHLLTVAHREPDGWTWKTLPHAAVRHLAGFAHGTAGIGLALLELARSSATSSSTASTGAGSFRFAAEMAFLAERAAYDPAASNWRDWRNMELGELYRRGRHERLRALAADQALPPYRARCMTAWCHGAPGIGLSRLRAWRLTRQTRHLDELHAALRPTVASLESFRRDRGGSGDDGFSLCHGVAGNAELLLQVARETSLQDDDRIQASKLRDLVEAVAERGRGRYELAGRPWPSGALGAAPDPSLLLGDAGIGLFYLRLAAPELATPLLVEPEIETQSALETAHLETKREATHAMTEEIEREVDAWFGATRWRWRRLGVSLDPPAPPHDLPLEESPAATVRRAIAEALAARGPELEALDATSRLERALFDGTRAIDDFTTEPLRDLLRTPEPPPIGQETRLALPPDARLVVVDEDELAAEADEADEDDEDDEDGAEEDALGGAAGAWLLLRRDQRLRPRPLPPLAAVIVQAIVEAAPDSASLPDLVEAVARALGEPAPGDRPSADEGSAPGHPTAGRVDAVVRQQVAGLVRARMLDLVDPEGGGA